MKHTIYLLGLTIILFSCKKMAGPAGAAGPAGPQGPQGPAGDQIPGQIIGKVYQYNQHNERHKTGLNTTTITLKGTSNTVVTDATGSYTLTNIPEGTHEMIVSRTGSKPHTISQVHMIGNGTFYYNFNIADSANFELTNAIAKDTMQYTDHAVKLAVTTASHTKIRFVVALYSSSNNINAADPSTYDQYYMIYINPGNTTTLAYTFDGYPDLPYNSGQKYYVKFYPCSGYNGTEYDYLNDKYIFTTAGTPFPTTFTLTMP